MFSGQKGAVLGDWIFASGDKLAYSVNVVAVYAEALMLAPQGYPVLYFHDVGLDLCIAGLLLDGNRVVAVTVL